jgi:hypothetical protein
VSERLIVVTAASSNHFGALCQMLESLRLLDARVECYDIGLTADEARSLPRWNRCTHRRFDYASYPAHMNVEINAGEYAWKPVIVAEVADRARAEASPSDVLWADAGCFFHRLDTISRRIEVGDGLWVRTSPGNMHQWTHPLTFAALEADPAAYASKPNADATLVGFRLGGSSTAVRERVYNDIIVPWKRCALSKDCIAPPGSSRKNHRQDQAVLSYLVHRAGFTFASDTASELGVRCKCDRWFYNRFGYRVPPGLYARTCLA